MQYIFGPVPSRRLGYSVGLDVVPYKYCSLDCVYCELGKTTCLTKKRASFFPLAGIFSELKDFLNNNRLKIDFLTFSGSGEPTLNADLGEIISFIKKVTDIPVAVLTNSTLLYLPEVRKSLAQADLVVPSIDAVSEEVFKKINRPARNLSAGQMIAGVEKFAREFSGRIWLETLICSGLNDSDVEVHKIAETISRIRCEKVQVGTVARPPADNSVRPLAHEKLIEISRMFGPSIEVIGDFQHAPQPMDDLEEKIIGILNRRPSGQADLAKVLKISPGELEKILDKLERQEKIIRVKFEKKDYFQKR